jgi:DNA polymerase V
MEMTKAPRKNITSSRSFGKYVTDLSDLEESISTHAAMAAKKLRDDGSVAGSITVFITTNVYSKTPQYGKAASRSLVPSTDCDQDLISAGKKVLHKIFKPGYRYIKAGVVLDELNPNQFRQTDIYAPRDYSKFERLFDAVDSTNQHFGGGTLHFLSTGIEKGWTMKMGYRSPRYTTRWEELAVVSA